MAKTSEQQFLNEVIEQLRDLNERLDRVYERLSPEPERPQLHLMTTATKDEAEDV